MKKTMMITALLAFLLACGNTVMDAYKDRWGNEDLNPRMNSLSIVSSDTTTITLGQPTFVKIEDPTPDVKAYIGYDGVISTSGSTVIGMIDGPIDVSSEGTTFIVLNNDNDYRIIVVAVNTINNRLYDVKQTVVPRTNIYVSTTGDDANPGTKLSPKLTIQAGIATVTYAKVVKVAAGTYNITSQIDMVEGRSLEGAWNPDFSSRNLATNHTILNETRANGNTIVFNAISQPTYIDGFTINAQNLGIYVINSSPVIRNNTIYLRKGFVDSENAFGIIMNNGSSPLVYNNVLAGGINLHNYNIFLQDSTASCQPKIYNNTFIIGRGNGNQWAFIIRQGAMSDYHHPYLKNNLFVHYYANSSSVANSIYHMNTGSWHYPYCYTTNLFYMIPYADGDGNYVYYGGGNINNVNSINFNSKTVSINGGTARILTYADAAWQNIVDVDPLLVDPANNNFHLSDSSPARASGTDLSGEITELTYDRDGNPRTAPWSIGAYENDN